MHVRMLAIEASSLVIAEVRTYDVLLHGLELTTLNEWGLIS